MPGPYSPLRMGWKCTASGVDAAVWTRGNRIIPAVYRSGRERATEPALRTEGIREEELIELALAGEAF